MTAEQLERAAELVRELREIGFKVSVEVVNGDPAPTQEPEKPAKRKTRATRGRYSM